MKVKDMINSFKDLVVNIKLAFQLVKPRKKPPVGH